MTLATAFPALIMGGLGLILGSFIGLMSLRLPAGQDVVKGRSRCQGCKRPITPWALIPILGYLVLRGRCRTCRSRIPVRYPVLELLSCATGVWAALAQPGWAAILLTGVLGWQLLLISVIDGEHFWLPDRLTLPLLLIGLLASLLPGSITPWNAIAASALGFAGLALLAIVYRRVRGREGLGDGDPILLSAGGAWVGLLGLPTVLLWACAAGLSLALARALRTGKASLSAPLPFGPCLAAGIWLTYLYGPLALAL